MEAKRGSVERGGEVLHFLPVSSSRLCFNIVGHRGTTATHTHTWSEVLQKRTIRSEETKSSVLQEKKEKNVFISIRDVEHGRNPEVVPPWSFTVSESASDQTNHVPGHHLLPTSLKAPPALTF